jgi:hypothetical protein
MKYIFKKRIPFIKMDDNEAKYYRMNGNIEIFIRKKRVL